MIYKSEAMKSYLEPNWYKLIKYWCKDLGRYGLTIPFLIGFVRLERKNPEITILSLLDEIQTTRIAKEILISHCDDLDEYVVGLNKAEYPNIKSLPRMGGFVINSDILEKYTNVAELMEFLSGIYLDKVKQSKYSKEYGTENWSDFTENDLSIIRKFIVLENDHAEKEK